MPDVPDAFAARIERLADAFVDRQGLDRPRATRIAAQIASADPRVADAAETWATTGHMPTTPEIEGETPARLAERFSPSQAFSGLLALVENPVVGRNMLKHPPVDPAGGARDWENRVRGSLRRLIGARSIVESPIGPDGRSRPDFLVNVGGASIIIEAKAIPARGRWLLTAIDQVEQYVVLFRASAGVIVVPNEPASGAARRGEPARVWVTTLERLPEALSRAAGNNVP